MTQALAMHNAHFQDHATTSSRDTPRSVNRRRLKAMERDKGIAVSTKLLRCLGNEKRISILYLLQGREQSVLELAAALGLRQPTVSQQLARLRSDELVSTRRHGQTIYYSLRDETTATILDLLAEVNGET